MARRGQPQGPRARDLSARSAPLALVLAVAAACATANVKVLQPLPERVRRVSIAIDPVEGATQAQLANLAQAIARPLILDGVSVVPRAPVEVPELIGHVTTYRPDLRLTTVWVLLGVDGATLGQCRTDFGASANLDAVDFGDAVQRTGEALAEFLAGP